MGLVYSLSSCVGCTDMFYWEEVIADIAINSTSFSSDKRIKHNTTWWWCLTITISTLSLFCVDTSSFNQPIDFISIRTSTKFDDDWEYCEMGVLSVEQY